MKDLIEALSIFLKYDNKTYPISCSDQKLHVNYYIADISQEDVNRLKELGFFYDTDTDSFVRIA